MPDDKTGLSPSNARRFDRGGRGNNAVVRLGKKTYRLTAALQAREMIVGDVGPAQRHLMSRYQAADEHERAELRRMWAVAMMRAQNVQWDEIAIALNEQDPTRYQSSDIWRDVYEAAEEATLGEAAADAIAALRKLCRSKSEYVRAHAAAGLLAARARQWKQRREEAVTVTNDGLTPETRALVEQVKALGPEIIAALLAEPADATIITCKTKPQENADSQPPADSTPSL